MEARLARQGLLAAPATILGAARRGADLGLFYDAGDALIDDTELEQVNAADRAECERARLAGAARCLPGGPAAAGGGHECGGAGRHGLDLAAFRLAGAEVSGTSGSEAGSDNDRELDPGQRGGRPRRFGKRDWRERLAGLDGEMALEALDPESAALAGPPEVVDLDSGLVPSASVAGAGAKEASLGRLRAALASVCLALEGAPRGVQELHGATAEALHALWRALPALFRLPSGAAGSGRGPARWRLLSEEGAAAAAAGPPCSCQGGRFFAWSEAEEAAWARLVLELVRGASGRVLPRRHFLQCWGAAALARREQALARAEAAAAQAARSTLWGEAFAAAEAAARTWPKFLKVSSRALRQRHLSAMRPAAKVLPGLWECWLRQRFWKDPRLAPCRAVAVLAEEDVVHPFGEYVVEQLREQFQLAVPLEMAIELAKCHIDAIGKASPETAGPVEAERLADCLPVQLPRRIFLEARSGCPVQCTLLSVRSLNMQQVLWQRTPRSRVVEFHSLQQVARAISKELARRGETAGPVLGRALQRRHGAWHAFRCGEGARTPALAGVVRAAHGKRVAPFANGEGSKPCPLLLPAPLAFQKRKRPTAEAPPSAEAAQGLPPPQAGGAAPPEASAEEVIAADQLRAPLDQGTPGKLDTSKVQLTGTGSTDDGDTVQMEANGTVGSSRRVPVAAGAPSVRPQGNRTSSAPFSRSDGGHAGGGSSTGGHPPMPVEDPGPRGGPERPSQHDAARGPRAADGGGDPPGSAARTPPGPAAAGRGQPPRLLQARTPRKRRRVDDDDSDAAEDAAGPGLGR